MSPFSIFPRLVLCYHHAHSTKGWTAMIERYTRPAMGRSGPRRTGTGSGWPLSWPSVKPGPAREDPKSSCGRSGKAGFSVDRIEAIEKVVKHDIVAFLTSVAEKVGPDSRYIHLGLTSYDVVDTALSLLIKESLERILADLRASAASSSGSPEYRKTVCIGRTHGIHAEPVTFGFKLLVWYEESAATSPAGERSADDLRRRISGSVGHTSTSIPGRGLGLRALKLRPAKVSTQVLQRDRHAEVLSPCAAGHVDREVRRRDPPLQRTEVLEVEEPFTKGQKGPPRCPQEESRPLREDLRPGPPGPGQRPGRARERPPLARARHLHSRPSGWSSRRLHHDGLPAGRRRRHRPQLVVHPDRMAANLGATRA